MSSTLCYSFIFNTRYYDQVCTLGHIYIYVWMNVCVRTFPIVVKCKMLFAEQSNSFSHVVCDND